MTCAMNCAMNCTLAIFAKTAVLSPVKTRLAAEIGQDLAEQFYHLSVNAVSEMAEDLRMQTNANIVPYWALAELPAIYAKQWINFPALWTGQGDLGQRLHTIYSALQARYDTVVLIGTDSPQLNGHTIEMACQQLRTRDNACVIGPAIDGGFYLFAAKSPIDKSLWTQVRYSQRSTCEALVGGLEKAGFSIHYLPTQTDVDRQEDLKKLAQALKEQANLLPLLPAQQHLYRWLKAIETH